MVSSNRRLVVFRRDDENYCAHSFAEYNPKWFPELAVVKIDAMMVLFGGNESLRCRAYK